MFPEISDFIGNRVKAWGASRAGTPSLGLEEKAGGIGVDWYARNGYGKLYEALTSLQPAIAGVNVNFTTAMNHSVVWACNRVISEPIGFLPLVMMQRKGATKRVADDQPAYTLLHDAPNDELTAQCFRESLTSHAVMRGNGFGKITRRSGTGTAIALDLLTPDQVDVTRERAGQKRLVYVVSASGEADKTYTIDRGKPQDILHLRGIGNDGVKGYSVLHMARQSWGTAIAAEQNVGQFFANGGRQPYLLKKPIKFKNDEEYKKFRSAWDREYARPHNPPLIEGDLEYKQIGMSMVDQQMLETRQFSVPEICRWFLVSPHLVGDLSRATFSNIEQLALEFVKMTLSAWLTRWEQELYRCLLTPEEKAAGYYFRHNLSALLRGDFASRMAGYATMLQNGIASIDEVRDLEDWNALPDGAGAEYHIQLNMQALPANAPQSGQSAQLIRLGKQRRVA